MRFDVITIFPDMLSSYCDASIVKRAREAGLVEIAMHDLRDYTLDKHRKVDDTPYGGGAGMVLSVEPIDRAVTAVGNGAHRILFSAKGKRFTQSDARRLAQYDRLVLVCGRYEGVDERVAEHVVDEELSIGDFVLTGGELAAMVVIDAVSRLLPGVLGNALSAVTESHSVDGILEYPQYTKPEEYCGWRVPEVLLSGHHARIEAWRKQS
jgi:tRNA (guanine37-N1)-methyltransferase